MCRIKNKVYKSWDATMLNRCKIAGLKIKKIYSKIKLKIGEKTCFKKANPGAFR